MKVLQLIAHPSSVGATNSFAQRFADGARFAGHCVDTYNIFQTTVSRTWFQTKLTNAEHLCLAWPCWWEMPPAKLVDLLQTTLSKGFAFDFVNGQRQVLLDLPTTCLISMGQLKTAHTDYLNEAMTYCGLKPVFYIFDGIGPGLPNQKMQDFLDWAYNAGQSI